MTDQARNTAPVAETVDPVVTQRRQRRARLRDEIRH